MALLSRKFSAPKTTDIEQWKKVQFLVSRGFIFQSVHETREDGKTINVQYPATLHEAKEFVVKYQAHAVQRVA